MAERHSENKGERVPATMRATFEAVVALTDTLCQDRLNEEYTLLCRKAAATLARKRPSPLATGKPQTWAAAIIHAIGRANFMDDASQTPHLTIAELYQVMGVSQSTGSAKSKQIRDLLKIHPFEPAWSLPGRMADNPLAWMISVDGYLIDVRHAPRWLQEEAFRQGAIPFLPPEHG